MELDNERKGLPSASSWRRHELCAGSWQLEAEAKKLGQAAHQTQSPEARRGTRIHAFLAGIPDEDGNEIKLTESEQETADFLQERAQEQIKRIFGDQPTKTLREKRLWHSSFTGQADLVVYVSFSSADTAELEITEDTALLVDFKSGYYEPDPAEQNAQLKVLAVLVALEIPTIKEVVCQVISRSFGVSEKRFSITELSEAYNDILQTLAKLEALDAPLTPGPEQCRYCTAINICSAVRKLAKPLTRLEVAQLPAGGERAAGLLDEIEVLKILIATIESFYEDMLLRDPRSIPGYVLAPGNTVRTVSNWEAAHARLAEFLDEGEMWGAASYRLGDIEKALGKKLKLKSPAAKAKVSEILGDLILMRQNSSSLKRDNGAPKQFSLK